MPNNSCVMPKRPCIITNFKEILEEYNKRVLLMNKFKKFIQYNKYNMKRLN